jgi:hypothetical protein
VTSCSGVLYNVLLENSKKIFNMRRENPQLNKILLPLLLNPAGGYDDGFYGWELDVTSCSGSLVYKGTIDPPPLAVSETCSFCILDSAAGAFSSAVMSCDQSANGCNYPSEYAWTITFASNSTVVASGGAGGAPASYGQCGSAAPTLQPTPCPTAAPKVVRTMAPIEIRGSISHMKSQKVEGN